MNHKLLHRINQIEAQIDRESLLRQCANSGQMEAAEVVAHVRAGELDLRRVATQPISRELGVEAALPSAFTNEPQPEEDQPTPTLRWFVVIFVLAFVLAAIESLLKGAA